MKFAIAIWVEHRRHIPFLTYQFSRNEIARCKQRYEIPRLYGNLSSILDGIDFAQRGIGFKSTGWYFYVKIDSSTGESSQIVQQVRGAVFASSIKLVRPSIVSITSVTFGLYDFLSFLYCYLSKFRFYLFQLFGLVPSMESRSYNASISDI